MSASSLSNRLNMALPTQSLPSGLMLSIIFGIQVSSTLMMWPQIFQPSKFISVTIFYDLYVRRSIGRIYAQESRFGGLTNLEYRISNVCDTISISRYQYINNRTISPVRFEVLTAVVMKISVLWDITQCSPLKVNRRIGGSHRFHLQGVLGTFSMLVSRLSHYSIMQIEVTCSSETSV
jgi:hypothetical protein